MRKILVVSGWIVSCCLLLLVSTTTLHFLSRPQYLQLNNQLSQGRTVGSVLAFKHLSDEEKGMSANAQIGDARTIIIEQYLDRYNSPMAGYAELIVTNANALASQYNLDPTRLAYLTIAIAQNESNLGKKMPANCFNPWGWGIHANGTLCFDSWEDGIPTYMAGLAKEYMYERGLTTPQEIMTFYTPHSPGGAWAKNVSQFMENIETASF